MTLSIYIRYSSIACLSEKVHTGSSP